MKRDFQEALANRRSYYSIGDSSPIEDSQIEDILRFALQVTPSAFNSQSTRLVLLLGDNHKRLWNIVLDTLREIVPGEAFSATEAKIKNSFASGYGSILFYEDESVISDMQRRFPTYADRFPIWSEQTSAMHQLVVWTMLEDAGFGASLQHYNPLIDAAVGNEWHIPSTWRLISQMPFGSPTKQPATKPTSDIDSHLKVFI